jgi:hypothetical protein
VLGNINDSSADKGNADNIPSTEVNLYNDYYDVNLYAES